jgi:hypothetical protein
MNAYCIVLIVAPVALAQRVAGLLLDAKERRKGRR